jgi:tetratricopeptide (TPR) repeat protein
LLGKIKHDYQAHPSRHGSSPPALLPSRSLQTDPPCKNRVPQCCRCAYATWGGVKMPARRSPEVYEELGRMVREWRKRRRMTKVNLAECVYQNRSMRANVWSVEKGKPHGFTERTALAYTRCLRMPPRHRACFLRLAGYPDSVGPGPQREVFGESADTHEQAKALEAGTRSILVDSDMLSAAERKRLAAEQLEELGDWGDARTTFEGEADLRARTDRGWMARVDSAHQSTNLGDLDSARTRLELLAQESAKVMPPEAMAWATHRLGWVMHLQGAYGAAASLFRQSREMAQQGGDYFLVAEAMHWLGRNEFELAVLRDSREQAVQALRYLATARTEIELRYPGNYYVAFLMNWEARAHDRLRECEDARKWRERALDIFAGQEAGYRSAFVYLDEGRSRLSRRDYWEAEDRLRMALDRYNAVAYRKGAADCLAAYAELAAARRNPGWVYETLDFLFYAVCLYPHAGNATTRRCLQVLRGLAKDHRDRYLTLLQYAEAHQALPPGLASELLSAQVRRLIDLVKGARLLRRALEE